jgi:hypothetical protein
MALAACSQLLCSGTRDQALPRPGPRASESRRGRPYVVLILTRAPSYVLCATCGTQDASKPPAAKPGPASDAAVAAAVAAGPASLLVAAELLEDCEELLQAIGE